MSQKISAKNLQYDTTLPPFLARLRGQAQEASGDGPDPLLVRNRRHAKPRSGSAEAEDAPLVVDEGGNVVAGMRVGADGTVVAETKGGEKAGEEGEEEDGDKGDGGNKGGVRENDKAVAGIGAGKKRKVGKVVGGGDEEEEGAEGREDAKKDGDKEAKSAATKKKKKVVKKIKLSFRDDDG
ncbi:hypothetical protein NKR19_g6368 [Coniochaeta hoffmannii]|uniref:DUF4604 domain-containing protein n=1 Tax=Coniochaeta hoffmannii TaxID=91930 RepID=A0AA38VTH1_9PEZI|nr:hypothetical protein NKR19_g6368 [Coniochaeta hoffmannii]